MDDYNADVWTIINQSIYLVSVHTLSQTRDLIGNPRRKDTCISPVSSNIKW